MKSEKNKINISAGSFYIVKTLMLVVCIICILLLVYIIGGLFYVGDRIDQGIVSENINPDEYFTNCQLIEPECLDVSCKHTSKCGSGHYVACRIYDCNDTYGIFTQDLNGVQKVNNKNKPDLDAVAKQIKDCNGTLDILDDKCVDGKEHLMVKITTDGICKIGGFSVFMEGESAKSNIFAVSEEGNYAITVASCGEVSKIKAVTENGISISF